MSRKNRTGSSLDSYFKGKGELEEVHEIALRRQLAAELSAYAKANQLTRVSLAQELQTSRPQLDRLLDPQPCKSITTTTLARAAAVVGKKLVLVNA